jgi:hypothetical protein
MGASQFGDDVMPGRGSLLCACPGVIRGARLVRGR